MDQEAKIKELCKQAGDILVKRGEWLREMGPESNQEEIVVLLASLMNTVLGIAVMAGMGDAIKNCSITEGIKRLEAKIAYRNN